MTGAAVRASAAQFLAVFVLVAAGAVALLVLLDPRAQAFWGGRASELGTAVRAAVDAAGRSLDEAWRAVQLLPYPGKP